MLTKTKLKAFLLPSFSNEHIVMTRLEVTTGGIWLISDYMPHYEEMEPLKMPWNALSE